MTDYISQSPTYLEYNWKSNNPSALTHNTFKEACIDKSHCIKDSEITEVILKTPQYFT